MTYFPDFQNFLALKVFEDMPTASSGLQLHVYQFHPHSDQQHFYDCDLMSIQPQTPPTFLANPRPSLSMVSKSWRIFGRFLHLAVFGHLWSKIDSNWLFWHGFAQCACPSGGGGLWLRKPGHNTTFCLSPFASPPFAA